MSQGDIVLNQLSQPRDVIGCFVSTDKSVFIVEPECIRFGQSADDLDYDSLENRGILGYVVGAALYLEPLTSKEYLFLVRRDGAMLIMDTDMQVIDEFDTGVELFQATHKILFAFEEKQRHVYCNLEPNVVYSIPLQHKKKRNVLMFLHTAHSLNVVQELDSDVVGLDITLNYDVSTNREFVAVATLSRSDERKQHYFQVVARTDLAESPRRMLKWFTIIPRRDIDLGEESFVWNVSKDSVLLKSVDNVGFFVFSTLKFIFISMPNGFANTVAGSELDNDTYECHAPFEQFAIEISNPNFKFLGLMNTKVNHDLIIFQICTRDFQHIQISFKLVFEDDDQYVKNWGKLETMVSNLLAETGRKGDIDIKTDSVTTMFPLPTYRDRCMLISSSGNLLLMNFDEKRIVRSCTFKPETFVTATSIGSISKKYIRSGFSKDNSYFVEQQPPKYTVPHSIVPAYDTDGKIRNIWKVSDGNTYWINASDNMLYLNGDVQNEATDIAYISKSNDILKGNDIIEVIHISGTEDSYCYIDKFGMLHWVSDDLVETYKLEGVSNLNHTNVAFTSVQKDNSNVTYLVLENRFLTVEQYGAKIKEITLPRNIGTIYSILYHCVGQLSNILLADSHGMVWIFDNNDLVSGTPLDISQYPVSMLLMPASNRILLYSRDVCVVLYPCTCMKLRYKYIQMDLPISIQQATYDNSDSNTDLLTVATTAGHISQLRLDHFLKPREDDLVTFPTEVLVTKFMNVPCSSRYVIGTYVSLDINEVGTLQMDSNGICSYNSITEGIVDLDDIANQFHNAVVTDMCCVPYRKFDETNSTEEANIPFAKQLIFNQCFLVSLNCELAETIEGPRLLLYMLDPENGKLSLRTYFDTYFDVNGVHNYYKDIFIAVGEYIQLFKIDYSVTEDIFHITVVSDKILTNGILRCLFELPIVEVSDQKIGSPRKKKQKSQEKLHSSFIALDFSKGFYEFRIESENFLQTGNISRDPVRHTIKNVKSSHDHPIVADISGEVFITCLSFNKREKMVYYIVCCGLNQVKLYFASASGGSAYDMVEFYLPHQVTSIDAIQGLYYLVDSAIDERGNLDDIFSITTTNNGHYIISVVKNEIKEDIVQADFCQNMKEHLHLIGSADYDHEKGEEENDDDDDNDVDDDSVKLIDNRILKNNELALV